MRECLNPMSVLRSKITGVMAETAQSLVPYLLLGIRKSPIWKQLREDLQSGKIPPADVQAFLEEEIRRGLVGSASTHTFRMAVILEALDAGGIPCVTDEVLALEHKKGVKPELLWGVVSEFLKSRAIEENDTPLEKDFGLVRDDLLADLLVLFENQYHLSKEDDTRNLWMRRSLYQIQSFRLKLDRAISELIRIQAEFLESEVDQALRIADENRSVFVANPDEAMKLLDMMHSFCARHGIKLPS